MKTLSACILFVLIASAQARAGIPQALAIRAIMGESRGESQTCREAVAEAVRNRAKLPAYRKDPLKGVYGLTARFTPSRRDIARAAAAWKASGQTDHVHGAQYFFSEEDVKKLKNTEWFKKLKFVTKISRISFYREEKTK